MAASEIGGVNTTIARLIAGLLDARYDLEQTTVTAPTDGYVDAVLQGQLQAAGREDPEIARTDIVYLGAALLGDGL